MSDWETVSSMDDGDSWETVSEVKKPVSSKEIGFTFPSFKEGVRAVAEESVSKLPVVRAMDSGMPEARSIALLEERLRTGTAANPEAVKRQIEKLKKESAFKQETYARTRKTIEEQNEDKVFGPGSTLVGSFGAEVIEPTNMIGLGPGKTLLTSIFRGAVPAGMVGFLQDWQGQNEDKALALRKGDPDALEAFYNAMFSAAAGGALNAGMFAGTALFKKYRDWLQSNKDKAPEANITDTLKKPEPKVEEPAPKAFVPESDFDLFLDLPDLPKSKADAKPLQQGEPLPEINWWDRVEPDLEQPNTFTQPYLPENLTEPPLPRLDPLDVSPTPAEFVGDGRTKAPALKKEFMVPEQVAPEQAMTPFPKIDNGFGPDVREAGPNPFIPREEVIQANVDNKLSPSAKDAAGTKQMDLIQEENALRARFLEESFNRTKISDPESFIKATSDFYTNQSKQLKSVLNVDNPDEFAFKVYKSATGGKVADTLQAVVDHAVDPAAKQLAARLQEFTRDVPFLILSEQGKARNNVPKIDNAVGLAQVMPDGSRRTLVRGNDWKENGINVETILHEASHNATDAAMLIGTNPQFRDMPKFKAHRDYVDAIESVFSRMRDSLAKKNTLKNISSDELRVFRNAVDNIQEFNVYAWTSPEFQRVLKQVKIDNVGTTAWTKFVAAVKNFFGIKGTALDAMLDLQKRLPDIQASKEDIKLALPDKKVIENKMLGKQLPDGVKNEIDSIVSPFPKTPEGMLQAMEAAGGMGDLKDYTGWMSTRLPTVNQAKNILKHPVITQAFDAVRTFFADSHVRMKEMDRAFKPLFKSPRKVQLEVAYGMTKLQTPEWQQAIRAANLTEASDDMLRSVGMSDKAIEQVKAVRPVLRQLLEADRESAARLGREINTDVVDYWPISHGGQFVVEGHIGDKLTHVWGFDSFADAKKAEKALQKSPDVGEMKITMRDRRADIADYNDFYNDWITGRNLPQWSKDVITKIENDKAAREATFELARTGVQGYIGQVLYPESNFLPNKENSRLLDVLNRRLRASRDFEVRSKITEAVLDPLLAVNPETKKSYLGENPNLYNFIIPWTNDLMGYNISSLMPIVDKAAQGVAELASKPKQLFDATINGYVADLSKSSISKDAAEMAARRLSLWASIYNLAGNVPNMMTNLANPLMTTSWIGIADTARLGAADPVQSIAWHTEALSRTLFGLVDQRQWAFIRDMWEKGYIQPHLFDDVNAIQGSAGEYRFDAFGRNVQLPGFQKSLNLVSNQSVEVANNVFHLMYYRNLVDVAERNGMRFDSPQQKELAVVDFAKSATGEYADYARRMLNKEMGTAGALTSNFQTWAWNQIGREVANMNRIALETGNVGVYRAYAPLLVLLTGGVAYMGLRNAPGFSDYETMRQYMKKLFGVSWKPADAVLEDMGVPKELRGSFLLDTLAPAMTGLSEEQMPDISSGQAFAPITQAPTVVAKFITDVGMFGSGLMERQLEKNLGIQVGGVMGTTMAEDVKFINSMPKGLRPYFQKEIKREFDKNYPVAVQGMYGLSMTQSPTEAGLNQFGLKSIRQRDEQLAGFNAMYDATQMKAQEAELKQAIISQILVGNVEAVKKNASELMKLNPEALENIMTAAESEKQAQALTTEEKLLRDYIKADKTGQALKIVKQLKRFGRDVERQ